MGNESEAEKQTKTWGSIIVDLGDAPRVRWERSLGRLPGEMVWRVMPPFADVSIDLWGSSDQLRVLASSMVAAADSADRAFDPLSASYVTPKTGVA